MGHHARTLTAVVAVLAATLAVASNASAFSSVVRVETRQMNGLQAFVPRMAVDTPGPVTVSDARNPAIQAQCPADSPVAAIMAAVGPDQVRVVQDPITQNWLIWSIKGNTPVATPPATLPATPAWSWRVYYDQSPIDHSVNVNWTAGNVCATPDIPSAGAEVLAYQSCGTANGNTTRACFGDTPLYMRVRDGGPYDITPQTVPGRGAPVVVRTLANLAPAAALLATDEASFTPVETVVNGPLTAQGGVSFTEPGPHSIVAVEKFNGNRPPARIPVCVSEGNDGFCGSTKVLPPPDIPYDPSPCASNGHDGFCGTTDTSGPITHVTNITNKKVFKAKKGPGQLKGTIETDPNGVKDVQLRLTRVVSVKVKVAVKKKKGQKKAKTRYKTVKRCSAWSDATALLVTQKKCGAKYAKWWTAELSDLRNEFSYSFAMTLPRGTYTLEVLAADEDGHKDATAHGRNVLTFTVK